MLDRVVEMEMVADVPLGSFLSGGIDSSSIVMLMKRHSNGKRISTYTVGMEPEDLRFDIIPDDVSWARRVGGLLDTDYNEIMLNPDVSSLLPKLVYHLDEPIADPAFWPVIWCHVPPVKAQSDAVRNGRTKCSPAIAAIGNEDRGALDPVPNLLSRPLMKAVAHGLPGGLREDSPRRA